jgi:hypothetical protein
MISNEKKLNYKVVDLVESYKFHKKIYLHPSYTKKLWFFKNKLTLTAIGHDGCSATVPNCFGHKLSWATVVVG